MARVVQTQKKIALLHRYPADHIKETNASFPYLQAKGMDVLTFKKFDRLSGWKKFLKSLAWIFYAPLLVLGKGYDILYLDDSYPFYPIFVKLASPKSKIVLRLGDLHLMYYYSGWFYNFLHFFEVLGWNLAYQILCISEPMRDYVYSEIKSFRSWGASDPWVIVIRDPVDPKDFPVNGRNNQGTVMFHGVITKNKNVDILLEAARRLPNVNFVVIGTGPDYERLEKMSPNNLFFRGWVPFKSIPRHISTCAIGVALRSDNPGNEYVVTSPFLQYGIMGKPCLVTRRKVFGDYEWQFSTVDEMVEKIKVLLTRPEEGEKLRDYILQHHDAKKIAESIWQTIL